MGEGRGIRDFRGIGENKAHFFASVVGAILFGKLLSFLVVISCVFMQVTC